MHVTATPATTPPPVSRQAGIAGDYQTFLKMLTTQMKYQDPLNPIDSADYAVQLATFSGVEAQTRTNQLLESLLAQGGGSGLAAYAGWVGQEARAPVAVAFDGQTPVDLAPSPGIGADRAVLVVRNAAGTVVAREDVALTATSHAWRGRDITGAPVPAGPYSFTLESHAGEALLGTAPVPAYARVTEVRLGPAGPEIVLAGGSAVPPASVTALRQPS